MEEKNDVIKQYIQVAFGTILTAAIGFLTAPVVTRLFDPEEYGNLTIFNSYFGLILCFAYLGLDKGIIRFFYTRKGLEGERQLLKLCVCSTFVYTIVIFAALNLLIKFHVISFPFSGSIFFLLLVYVIITVINTYSNNLLRLTHKTSGYSFCLVVQKITYIVSVILLVKAFSRNDLFIWVIATILSVCSSAAIALFLTKDLWHFRRSSFPADSTDIYRYSFPFAIYALLITLVDSMDKFFIERYCSDYEVGVYTSSFTLIVFLTLAQSVFNTVWSPVQTEHFTKDPDDTSFIQKGNRYITVLLFILGITIIASRDLIVLLLGSSYREATIYVPFILIDSLMMILSETVNTGINISKKSYLFLFSSAGSFLIDLLLLLILVPRIGALGGAIARCFASISFYYITLYFSIKNYFVDYGNKKMAAILLITLIYAFIDVFINKKILNLVLYFMLLIIMFAIYKNDIKEMRTYLIGMLKDRIRR